MGKHRHFYYKLNDDTLIVTTSNGTEFQMDSKFEYLLNKHSFFADYYPKSNNYYIKYRHGGKNKRLHRLLTNCPDNLEVDHISGNTLDNTLKNLRNVTKKQNMRNKSIYSTNTSGVKGVNFDRFNNRWRSTWCDDEGKKKSKSFRIDLYPNAKELAIEHRKQKEKELNITHH